MSEHQPVADNEWDPQLSPRYTHGFVIENGEVSSEPIPLTPENRHFFIYNIGSKRFELVRHGTALIVNMLRMEDERNSPDFTYHGGQFSLFPTQRQLAFFDASGNFFNQLFLQSLQPREDSGKPDLMHSANFTTLDGSRLPVEVSKIYSLAPAAPMDIAEGQ